jgi:hypothetical protein
MLSWYVNWPLYTWLLKRILNRDSSSLSAGKLLQDQPAISNPISSAAIVASHSDPSTIL